MVWGLFVLGLLLGSFLNAVIYRLKSGQSIFETHSRCPRCKHELAFLDLIPVVSFFMLGGRCRYCGKKISLQYPLVEIVTGFAFAIIYLQLSVINYQLWFELVFVCFLIVIFVYDLKHYLILDKVVFPAAALALFFQAAQGRVLDALMGGLLLAGFFWLLYAVSRGRWIGAGDIKLGLFLGFLVPFPQTLVLFFVAYLSGAALSAVLLLMKSKTMASRLPFGTFLTFAAFIAMIWGEELVNWYFKLIGIK